MKLFELIFDEDDEKNGGVYSVSIVNSPAIGIEAIQLSDESKETNHYWNKEIVEALKKIGKTPLKYNKDYRLMRVEEISDDTDLTSLNFASEDNKHFEIRYRYAGKLNHNSRDFCRTMLSWNREWTLDEIELLNDLNPAFAPKGKTEYSVLKYSGGVNCKHSFQRLIYLNQKDSALTYDEALKQMPKNLIKQIKKLPKEVGQVASASNNFWRLNYSSEKEQILTSPILIPNQKIYRQNIKGDEAYVFASADTIKRLAQNFFKNSYQTNSTIEHDEPIDGVYIFESWLVEDNTNDKSNALGFDVPNGTWMVSMKLSNDLWQEYVESGQIKGLSIDALLDVKEVDNQTIKLKNENQKMLKKDFLQKIKSKVKLKFSDEMTLVDSELQYSFIGTEPVGATLVDADGNAVADFKFAFDGVDYITNADGVIDLFVEEETPAEEIEMNDEDVNDVIETINEQIDEKDAKITELESKVAELEAKLSEKDGEVVELKKQTPAKKIGFSKETVEAPKNETFLEMTRRMRK